MYVPVAKDTFDVLLEVQRRIDLVDEGGVLGLSCMKMKTIANAAVRWLTVLSEMSECFAGLLGILRQSVGCADPEGRQNNSQ